MLQARLVSYADAHLYRLGTNHTNIPVNKPRCPVTNFIRDGYMTSGDYGAKPNYWPNSVPGTPQPDPKFADPAWALGQTVVDRFDSTLDHDDFTQPGNLYRMFDEGQKDRLTTRITGGLRHARPEVQMRQLCHFFRADADYGRRVAQKLGIDIAQMEAGHPKPELATV